MTLTTPFTTYPPLHQLLPIRSIIDPNLKIVCPCNPSRYWSPANPDNRPPCSSPLLPTRLPQLQPRTALGCTIRGWVRAPCLLRAFSGLCNLSVGAVLGSATCFNLTLTCSCNSIGVIFCTLFILVFSFRVLQVLVILFTYCKFLANSCIIIVVVIN